MPSQEKAVIKAMRRHQRDGRRFRDLLIHCACGWKSPALKARQGSNDFALAREDQAKSFERHIAREVLAATATPESAGLLARLSASGGRNIDLLKRAQAAEKKASAVREIADHIWPEFLPSDLVPCTEAEKAAKVIATQIRTVLDGNAS